MPPAIFVGRADERAELLQLAQTSKDGVVVAVRGVHGIGKTCFLDHVLEQARSVEGIISPLRTEMEPYAIGLDADQHSGDALWRTFDRSQLLLQRLGRLTGTTQEFARFTDAMTAEAGEMRGVMTANAITASDRARFGNIEMATNLTLDEETVKDAIRRSQRRIDDAFVEGWTTWSARRRMLIALDHFDVVAGTALGEWILRMALRLPHLTTLISCAPSTVLPASGHQVRAVELLPFTPEEVDEYLRVRFDPITAAPDIGHVTHRFTDGHPGGVKLVADLVSERGVEDVDAAELRRTLDRLPEKPWEQWAQLVKLILEPVEGSALFKVIEASAVSTTFDEPLLRALVGDDTPLGDAIATLKGFGLVQSVETNVGGLSDRFSVRSFVRRALERRLRTHEKLHWLELHRRAAEHHFETLTAIEDGDSGYGGWFRYENPDWQQAKMAWLFHSAHLADAQELTRARFATVFLEAFYWWGCYEPFAFNRQLLWDWTDPGMDDVIDGQAPAPVDDKEDEHLREALSYVLDHYPIGHVKASDDWPAIATQLRLVEGLCGLGRGGKLRRSRDGIHLRGLLRTFLAHTERFASSNPSPAAPSQAVIYYDEARQAFERLVEVDSSEDPGDEVVDSVWLVAWIQFEQADLAVEEARFADAVRGIAESAATLHRWSAEDDDWDEELVADLCRARADVHWSSGEHSSAFEQYGRAARHAYRFLGIPHPPDAYTRRFYDEITGRVVERVVELAEQDPPSAARAVESLRDVIPPEAGGADPATLLTSPIDGEALRAALFAPGPVPPDELDTEKSAFMDRWRLDDDGAPDTEPDVAALFG